MDSRLDWAFRFAILAATHIVCTSSDESLEKVSHRADEATRSNTEIFRFPNSDQDISYKNALEWKYVNIESDYFALENEELVLSRPTLCHHLKLHSTSPTWPTLKKVVPTSDRFNPIAA